MCCDSVESYKYGTYKFHTKSMITIDPARDSISNVLPKDFSHGVIPIVIVYMKITVPNVSFLFRTIQ